MTPKSGNLASSSALLVSLRAKGQGRNSARRFSGAIMLSLFDESPLHPAKMIRDGKNVLVAAA